MQLELTAEVIISVVIGFILSMTEDYGILFVFVKIVIILDLTTEFYACYIKKVIPHKMIVGEILKKTILFIGLLFGMFLDSYETYFIEFMSVYYNIEIEFFIPVAFIIGAYIIICESIIICENLYLCGVPMPAVIIKSLKISKESIDNIDINLDIKKNKPPE